MPAVQYVVEGGRTLHGTIRPSGNKNAALPIVAAALLSENTVHLDNVPHIRDIETLMELIRSVGASIEWTGDNSLKIEAPEVIARDLDAELCAKIRASILLAAPLLARCGEVILPPPGGDVIGRRRLDTHFLALEQLGATVSFDKSLLRLQVKGFKGADVFLDEPSVTATENALVAACAAQGKTILRNAASEPHVQDLAQFLRALGAHIDGVGTNCITIDGGRPLGREAVSHTIGPDHIEVGSFIGLAAVTHSELRIEKAGIEHLRSTRMGFERLGIVCEAEGDDLIVPAKQTLKIQADLGDHVPKLEDQPWPAFPADTMSIAIVTATQCEGLIMMHEKMFESRLFFVDKLIAMGAKIVLCDPHRALVAGPSRLRGATLDSPDIRAGMALLIAALCAEGRSIINNVGQIERGYERIDHRLRALGASVERVADRRNMPPPRAP
ncbi:MAG TPA: UDP-N-acetylglucosamine 1-carboxyvinyltransferase [Gemmatimonadaceae bacterium]|nr:UDP-N-acetylglucosamine 1-carboxyvinyltransferase [Gemmatimonadaceae bacterium]